MLIGKKPERFIKKWPKRSAIRLNGGQGRDRTVDLPIFSRTLVPTELPGREARV